MEELTQRQVLAAMKSAPMFSALPAGAAVHFLSRCTKRRYRKDEFIVWPSQKAESFFVILRGGVKVFKLSPGGGEQILHLLGPGESFGEAAMWSGGQYPAHAQAVSDSVLLAVSRKTLTEALAGNVDLAVGMLIGLSNKLREFSTLIEQLSLKDVPARLAAALLDESRHAGSASFSLTGTKRQLAARIGTVAETLSRSLGKMRAEGLLKVRGSHVTIVDGAGLRALAEGGRAGR